MLGFWSGFNSFFRALGFITRHRKWHWYLVPLLLWGLLFFGSTFSLAAWLTPKMDALLSTWLGTPVSSETEGFWQTLKSILRSGLGIASSVALHLILWYALGRFMKYVILIVSSPFLAWVSERTEELTTGRSYPFQIFQLLKDAWRGILITLRNLFLEFSLIALVFAVSLFFPVIAPIAPFFLFFVNCYFMGFSMCDYFLERRKMSISESVRFIRANRSRVLGLGLAYNLVSMFPFLDWVVAPIHGAAGAVLCFGDGPGGAPELAPDGQ